MNQNEAIIIGLFAVPILILMVLRINATMVFLGLCLGYVLMQFLGLEVKPLAEGFLPHAPISTSVMKLVLLLFPAVFTAIVMVHTVRGTKLLLNTLPAIGVGCLSALLVVPLLPSGTAHAITDSALWHQAIRLQDLIIGISALISLLTLWLQRSHQGGDHDKHHR